MCTREELQEIIDNSVIKHLSRHEGKELAFHNLIIKNQTMLDDKLDQALISVRESVPSSLTKILTEMKDNQGRIESKVDGLQDKINPAIDAIDVAKKLKKGVIWIAGFIIAVAGIITSITHIRGQFK